MRILNRNPLDGLTGSQLARAFTYLWYVSRPLAGEDYGALDLDDWRVDITSAKRNEIAVMFTGRNAHKGNYRRVVITNKELIQSIRPAIGAGRIEARSAGAGVLRFAALLLPPSVRCDWLEEHRGYLSDLPTRRIRALWLYRELRGMLRYAYTVRTSARKEVA